MPVIRYGSGLDACTQYLPPFELPPFELHEGSDYARRSWENWKWSWSMTLIPGPICLVSGV